MVSLFYIFLALLTVLPITIFVLYVYNSNEGKSSWGGTLRIIAGFFFTIAFFYYLEERLDIQHLLDYAYIGFTAFIPVIFYIYCVTSIDMLRPEPLNILLLSILIGSIATLPLVAIGVPLFHGGFYSEISYNISDSIIIGFIKIAIPSELAKWLFLLIFLSLNKFYDEYFDGIVYSVCLSMVFACVVGIWYMSDFIGFSFFTFLRKSLVTALLLIPIHFITGAIMGYFVSMTRSMNKAINYGLALLLAIIVSGLINTMLVMMGNYWYYYFVCGIVLLIMSIVVYKQMRHLLRLDLKNER